MPFESNIFNVLIDKEETITHAIKVVEQSTSKICLVKSGSGSSIKLIGTITDGDIRRAILDGIDIDDACNKIMNVSPLTANDSLSIRDLESLLLDHQVRHIPITSDDSYLVGLYYSDVVTPEAIRNSLFVIMAGGFGTRLQPYTENTPKPMLLVQGKPILQHIIENAKVAGFHKFVMLLHYLPEVIKDFFGDGSKFGVSIEYIVEKSPLGTAGGLSLIKSDLDNYSSVVVTNGDLVTDIDYQGMTTYHLNQKAIATMCVRKHKMVNEFGTVEIEDNYVTSFIEKPIILSNINAGIYVLNPEILSMLGNDEIMQMPDLLMSCVTKGHKVAAYYLYESWNDVGRLTDLNRVNGS